MQKNHFLLLKKWKNTGSAQLCYQIPILKSLKNYSIQITKSSHCPVPNTEYQMKFSVPHPVLVIFDNSKPKIQLYNPISSKMIWWYDLLWSTLNWPFFKAKGMNLRVRTSYEKLWLYNAKNRGLWAFSEIIVNGDFEEEERRISIKVQQFNPLVPRVSKIKIRNLTLNVLQIVKFVKKMVYHGAHYSERQGLMVNLAKLVDYLSKVHKCPSATWAWACVRQMIIFNTWNKAANEDFCLCIVTIEYLFIIIYIYIYI